MANNGYYSGEECIPTYSHLTYQACLSFAPTTARAAVFLDSTGKPVPYSGSNNVVCHNSSKQNVGFVYVDLTPQCVIPGPPLNEHEQIEAVNAVFAAVLVALCVIWGVKMVYNTLISNPRGE